VTVEETVMRIEREVELVKVGIEVEDEE